MRLTSWAGTVFLMAVGLSACESFGNSPGLRHHEYEFSRPPAKLSDFQVRYTPKVPGSNERRPSTYVPALFANAAFQERIDDYLRDELGNAALLSASARPERKLTCEFNEVRTRYVRILLGMEPAIEVSVRLHCQLDEPAWAAEFSATGVRSGRNVGVTTIAVDIAVVKIARDLVHALAARLQDVHFE